jgi:hypothetical protein
MAFATDFAIEERDSDIDPLRSYDRLNRNQPRRLGFMELVVRPNPWILRMFTGRVPDEFIAQVGIGEVEVPCPCRAVTAIRFNIATPCEGECGRWFWYFAGTVRVAYSSPEEQEDQDAKQDNDNHQGEEEGQAHLPE